MPLLPRVRELSAQIATADERAQKYPPIGGGDPTLSPVIVDLNRRYGELHREATQRYQKFEEARNAAAAAGKLTDPESPEYKAAHAANASYGDVAKELRKLEAERNAAFDLMRDAEHSPAPVNGNGPQDGDAYEAVPGTRPPADFASRELPEPSRRAVQNLTRAPGQLLSTVLHRRKRDVATLPEHIRMGAVPQLTTAGGGTIEESAAVIDLLAPLSVALASGIPSLTIDSTETRVPRFTDLPVAGWIAELAPFPKSGPGIEMVQVKPPKAGLVQGLSIEVFEDLRPLTLSMVQTQLLRAVSLAYDHGILFGTGAGNQPRGIANAPGIGTITAPLTNLGAFAQAIAKLVGTNSFPGALVMNPVDLGALLTLGESDASNKPLWTETIERAANGVFALRLPNFGTPIWPTPAAPVGTALLYDPGAILAVIRREVDLAIDPYYDFDNGEVGLRVYIRGDVVVGQAAGAVKITFGSPATAAASTDVVTSSGHGLNDGDALVFSDLTGGAPLTAGTTYYARDVSGATFKVAETLGGAAIDITSNMTAGTVRRVWSF